jgi:hypothetical protein
MRRRNESNCLSKKTVPLEVMQQINTNYNSANSHQSFGSGLWETTTTESKRFPRIDANSQNLELVFQAQKLHKMDWKVQKPESLMQDSFVPELSATDV